MSDAYGCLECTTFIVYTLYYNNRLQSQRGDCSTSKTIVTEKVLASTSFG